MFTNDLRRPETSRHDWFFIRLGSPLLDFEITFEGWSDPQNMGAQHVRERQSAKPLNWTCEKQCVVLLLPLGSFQCDWRDQTCEELHPAIIGRKLPCLSEQEKHKALPWHSPLRRGPRTNLFCSAAITLDTTRQTIRRETWSPRRAFGPLENQDVGEGIWFNTHWIPTEQYI